MKNIDEMTSKELKEFAQELVKKAKFKSLLEEKGFNEEDLVPMLIKTALESNEKVVFHVEILNTYFPYEKEYNEAVSVKNIAINGLEIKANQNKYLPKNFAEDLKKLGIKDFIVCGEIPIRLIKEFDVMGCKLNGLYPGSMINMAAQAGALMGAVRNALGPTKPHLEEGHFVDLKIESLKEPGLYFTI